MSEAHRSFKFWTMRNVFKKGSFPGPGGGGGGSGERFWTWKVVHVTPGFYSSNLISGGYRKYLGGRESTDLGRKKAEKRATSPGEARRETADPRTQIPQSTSAEFSPAQPAEKRTRRPVPTPLQHAMRLG